MPLVFVTSEVCPSIAGDSAWVLRRTRPLGHGTLGIRRDHLVVGGDHVPARLGLPRRFTDLAAESLHAPRDLRVSHESGSFCVHIGCEGSAELRPVEEQIAVLRRQYRW